MSCRRNTNVYRLDAGDPGATCAHEPTAENIGGNCAHLRIRGVGAARDERLGAPRGSRSEYPDDVRTAAVEVGKPRGPGHDRRSWWRQPLAARVPASRTESDGHSERAHAR